MATYAPHSNQRNVAEINITPLVDVMLVLLVIFMIAAPVIGHPITLDTPGTDADKQHLAPPPPIRLRVDAGGTLYWNGDATTLAVLRNLLEAEVARDPRRPPTLEIDASDEADYGVIAKVLAAARNAEVSRIGFLKRGS